jgi:hypothetical protein
MRICDIRNHSLTWGCSWILVIWWRWGSFIERMFRLYYFSSRHSTNHNPFESCLRAQVRAFLVKDEMRLWVCKGYEARSFNVDKLHSICLVILALQGNLQCAVTAPSWASLLVPDFLLEQRKEGLKLGAD